MDFQPIEIKNLKQLKNHMLKVFPNEGCGYIVGNKFIPLTNINDDPEINFTISSDDYMKYNDNIQAVVHSHTCPLDEHPFNKFGHPFDMRSPSMADMEAQMSMNVPFGICSTEGENVSNLVWFGAKETPPLMERPYIPNIYDCYTLGRDFYIKNFGIRTEITPRPPKWEEYNPRIYETNYEENNFVKLEKHVFDRELENLQLGDCLMICFGKAGVANHLGVYVGDGNMFSHFGSNGRLPEIRPVGVWWEHTKFLLRHKELFDREDLIDTPENREKLVLE